MAQFIIKPRASLKTKYFESDFMYYQWLSFPSLLNNKKLLMFIKNKLITNKRVQIS